MQVPVGRAYRYNSLQCFRVLHARAMIRTRVCFVLSLYMDPPNAAIPMWNPGLATRMLQDTKIRNGGTG